MNLSDLQKTLPDVNRSTILGWIRDGMPVESKRPYVFSSDAVWDWLVAKGIAVDPTVAGDVIHRTRAEIARAVGVSPRTVSDWAADPTFPGRMGDALAGDGYFPEAAIREWISGKSNGSVDAGPLHVARIQSLATKTALDELKLQERRGELVEIAVVERELARAVAIARQKLSPLAEIMVRLLPTDMAPSIRDDFRCQAERAVEEACEAVATAMEAPE